MLSRKRWGFWAAIGLIAVHGVMLVSSACVNSVTYDESAHLAAGCAYWKYHDFSIYNLSPPPLRMWGAWPAMLAGAKAPPSLRYHDEPPDGRQWTYAEEFGKQNAGQYQRIFLLGRLAMIPISMFGAWVVFAWSRRLYGDWAGVGSCAIYALDPNFCAHGSIVGTDVGFAVAMLLAVRCWVKFCEEGKPSQALTAALAVAAAHLCKAIAFLLWPLMPVIFLMIRWKREKRFRDLLLGMWISMIATWFGINASFGFWRPYERLGSFEFQSGAMRWLQAQLPRGMPVMLAREFLIGFDAQAHFADIPSATYFLGQLRPAASPIYYPVALIFKEPVATVLLVAGGVGFMCWRRRRGEAIGGEEWSLMLVAVVVLVGVAWVGRVNAGMRYVIAMLPPLYILAGGMWRRQGGAIIASCLLVMLLAENLTAFPRYFTFFNAAAHVSGWDTWKLSGLDFDSGQSLIDLRDWMRKRHVDEVSLAYFGRVDPSWYGIEYSPLIGSDTDQYVAISQMFLTGIPERMRLHEGVSPFGTLEGYDRLPGIAPAARVGSIYIYERRDIEAANLRWRVIPNQK